MPDHGGCVELIEVELVGGPAGGQRRTTRSTTQQIIVPYLDQHLWYVDEDGVPVNLAVGELIYYRWYREPTRGVWYFTFDKPVPESPCVLPVVHG